MTAASELGEPREPSGVDGVVAPDSVPDDECKNVIGGGIARHPPQGRVAAEKKPMAIVDGDGGVGDADDAGSSPLSDDDRQSSRGCMPDDDTGSGISTNDSGDKDQEGNDRLLSDILKMQDDDNLSSSSDDQNGQNDHFPLDISYSNKVGGSETADKHDSTSIPGAFHGEQSLRFDELLDSEFHQDQSASRKATNAQHASFPTSLHCHSFNEYPEKFTQSLNGPHLFQLRSIHDVRHSVLHEPTPHHGSFSKFDLQRAEGSAPNLMCSSREDDLSEHHSVVFENLRPINPSRRRVPRSMSMSMAMDIQRDHQNLQRTASQTFHLRKKRAISEIAYIKSLTFGASREQAHHLPRVVRKTRNTDIQTGGDLSREVIAQRIIDYPLAMNPTTRRQKVILRRYDTRDLNVSMHGNADVPQWRIHSKSHALNHMIGSTGNSEELGAVTSYLHWSFRSNFLLVLLSEALAFWFLVAFFATCIYVFGILQPECIELGKGLDFESGGNYYIDAFALSWTTFATVGYGMIHPSVHDDGGTATQLQCSFFKIFMAAEAFVGILFASFCGAVIVGKVTRAKSTASVVFSEPIVLRFGSGCMFTNDDDDKVVEAKEPVVTPQELRLKRFPCPILEFRVCNALYKHAGGEIMNSNLNVVVSTLAADDDVHKSSSDWSRRSASLQIVNSLAKSTSDYIRTRVKRSLSSDTGDSGASTDSETRRPPTSIFRFQKQPHDELGASAPDLGRKSARRSFRMMGTESMGNSFVKKRILRRRSYERQRDEEPRPSSDQSAVPLLTEPHKSHESPPDPRRVCVDEDPTGLFIARRVFSTLKIESANHPFFKRSWTVRHVLDADSPLLSQKAQKLIRGKGRGQWPAEACNYFFIRKNIHFDQLIVSLSGTATVNGCKVYGLHVYEMDNLRIGYTFSSILDRAQDGRLVVDLEQIDEIREQRGGRVQGTNKSAANPSAAIRSASASVNSPPPALCAIRSMRDIVEADEPVEDHSEVG